VRPNKGMTLSVEHTGRSQLNAGVRRTRCVPGPGAWARARRENLLHSIRSRVSGAVIVGIVTVASVLRSEPGDGKPVRAVAPSQINWSAVSGYPPGYARAMLEGEAGNAVPFTYRVRLPPGFTFRPHTHAGDEHVTVLQGAWSFGVGSTFDRSRLRSLPVGSFVVIPAGTPHFVATESETIIQVHGIGPIGFRFVGDPGGKAGR
jgi:quercetin dioxygenase-like cupin family protein